MAKVKLVVVADVELPDDYQVQDFTVCSEAAQALTADLDSVGIMDAAKKVIKDAIEATGLPGKIGEIKTAVSVGGETKVTGRRRDDDGELIPLSEVDLRDEEGEFVRTGEGKKIKRGIPETIVT